MKTMPNLCAFAVALALTACQTATSPGAMDSAAAPAAPAAAAAASTRYLCSDGSTVDARYPSDDSAHLVYKGQPIKMKLVVSASGARYTGGGWEWWTKGRTEGYLSPLPAGETIASSPGLSCTAQ